MEFLDVSFPQEIIYVVCDWILFMFMWLEIVFLISQKICIGDSVFNFIRSGESNIYMHVV